MPSFGVMFDRYTTECFAFDSVFFAFELKTSSYVASFFIVQAP